MTAPRCAVMQPTYLPWIGYLAMVDRVDQFVFLDTVGFAKRSWQQRNCIRNGNGKLMLTVPVNTKGRSGQQIKDVGITTDSDFVAKHQNAIRHAYSKAPFYSRFAPSLFTLLNNGYTSLSTLTIEITRWLLAAFEISTPIQRTSELPVKGTKAELLVNVCEVIGTTRYLSAPGSREYIEESRAFERAGIIVEYHDYKHPRYQQRGDGFLSHIAAIDLLLNEGAEAGLEILRSGVIQDTAPS